MIFTHFNYDILMEQKIIIMNTEKIKSGIVFGGFISKVHFSNRKMEVPSSQLYDKNQL